MLISSVAGSKEGRGSIVSDFRGDETSSCNISSFLLSHADDFVKKKPTIKKNDSKVLARKKEEDCDTAVSNSENKPSKQGAKSLIKENKKITRNKENDNKEETCR